MVEAGVAIPEDPAAGPATDHWYSSGHNFNEGRLDHAGSEQGRSSFGVYYANPKYYTQLFEELKAMIDSPDLVVLDIHQGKDWTSSEHKIQGAVRENPGKPDEWAAKYDKEKTVVLYCA